MHSFQVTFHLEFKKIGCDGRRQTKMGEEFLQLNKVYVPFFNPVCLGVLLFFKRPTIASGSFVYMFVVNLTQ